MKKSLLFFSRIFGAWLISVSWLSAGPRHSSEQGTLPPTPLSAADAAAHLEGFRHAWLLGDMGLSFDFVHRPRRAEETTYSGLGWTSTNQNGLVTRFQLAKVPANKTDKPEVWQWLLQNGPSPHVWVLAPGENTAREVPVEKWRDPLLPGMIYTPFDLMMPFLYWTDFKYENTMRISRRGVDIYTMNPPSAEKAAGLGPVKLFIDREYNALTRMQQLNAKSEVSLEFNLGNVAKIEDQWMFEDCELINQASGDDDRFVVKSVAMKLKLDPALFEPENLAKPMPQPPASAWHNL